MTVAFLVVVVGSAQSFPDSASALREARELVHDHYTTILTHWQQQECRGRDLDDCMEGDWSCVDFVCPSGLAGRRAALIARLERLAPSAGQAPWLFRQRVSLALKAGERSRAAAIASACVGEEWWCQTLRGLTTHRLSPGEGLTHFDSAFALLAEDPGRSPGGGRAWDLGPDAACIWSDPRTAAPMDLLPEARAWRCDEEAEERERFWWLADPLWSRPGNGRYLEHLSRHVMIRMALDVLEDSRDGTEVWMRDEDDVFGVPYAIALRQGFPNSRRRMENPPVSGAQVTGVRGSAPYVEGGYGFAPDSSRFRHPLASTMEDWALPWLDAGCASPWTERAERASGSDRLWLGRVESLEACGQERYIPRETWHDILDQQTAVFRRGGELLVVSAAQLPAGVDGGPGVRSALALGRIDDLTVRSSPATVGPLRVARARAVVPDGGRYLASIEVVGPDNVGRARFGLPAPPLSDGFGVSDLALVHPSAESGDLPLEEVILPSLAIPPDSPVSLYFEVYGLDADEAVDVSFEVQSRDAGFLDRVGRFLGITSDPRPVELQWNETPRGREGMKRVFFTVDVESLDQGDHRFRVSVRRAAGQVGVAEREVLIH